MERNGVKLNEVFDRSKHIKKPKEVHFQSLSWNHGDFEIDDDSDMLEYIIYISGVNSLGQSVCLKVTGFTPYFYVLIPDSWKKNDQQLFFNYIKKKLYKNSYGLADYNIVEKMKLYPYLAKRKFKFMRLIFKTDKAFNNCARYILSSKKQEETPIKIDGICEQWNYYEAFETNINHLNRFCHVLDIETTGWIRVEKFKEETNDRMNTQISVTTKWKNVKPDKNMTLIAPLTIYSWDIECLPENTEEFPNPELENDVIKQISVVLVKYGTQIKQSFIFTSSPCDPIKHCGKCGSNAENIDQEVCTNTIKKCKKTCKKKCKNEECKHVCGNNTWTQAMVVESKTEKELLETFCKFIGMVDPDIMTGFNTWGFDDKYFWKRMELHNVDAYELTRINSLPAKFTKKELSSSAYGNNTFEYILFPGRETFDVMVAVRRENKLESYSLNAISEEFLKDTKKDLDIRIMFEKLVKGPKDVAECAVYCIQDSNLTVRLFLKMSFLPNYVEMAKATYVPMEWLLFRGQQCKVFSLLAKDARLEGYVIPVHEKVLEEDKKFKGATVIEPMIGAYYVPVAGMDFASLYPSIMIAYNMCYTTLITTPEMMKYVQENGIEYHTVAWSSCIRDECKEAVCGHEKVKHSYSFVQAENREGKELSNGTRGILPSILLKLMHGRKATKKLMKDERDEFVYAVLNGKQLAQKVTMNSVYGFTGANNGFLPEKRIAASVTATGRLMINQTSKVAQEEFSAITIYGDSIPPDELITIGGKDVTVEDFANDIKEDWKEYRGFKVGDVEVKNKEYKDLERLDYITMTHQGYQKVKKIIRHTTNKKIYKITAKDKEGKLHTVRVTEGHSLVLDNGELITPDKLDINCHRLMEY